MKPVAIDTAKCDVCGLCVEVCGRGGVEIADGRIVLGGARCMECGHCVALCPAGALTTELGLPPDIDRRLVPSPAMVENFLRARRSHRLYEKREIPVETVERLVDLAHYAPSGKNEQPFAFVALRTPEARRAFTEACFERMGRAQRKLANPVWRWFVGTFFDRRVQDPKVRRSLERALRRREMGMDPLFFNAPLILFVHGPAVGATPKDDCCYALFHAVLLAEAMGLGSCINGNSEVLIHHFPDLLEPLGIPADRRVYACATFGYPRLEYLRYVYRQPAQARLL
jgi:nitroreductase/NAD-dependent dihydropyrimidine dehydrogenase PreA subunit